MATIVSGKRVRYRLTATKEGGKFADYAVSVQDAPRKPWREAGQVSRFGEGSAASWAALGKDAAAWTKFRGTRGEAVADMLAGLTFLSYQVS